MVGQEERVRNYGWNHGAGDHRAHQVGVLRLRDDLVIEPEQRGDGAEGETGGHHQRVVGAGGAIVFVHTNRTSSVAGAAISAGTETNDPARMK